MPIKMGYKLRLPVFCLGASEKLVHRASFRIIFARSRLTNTSPTTGSWLRQALLFAPMQIEAGAFGQAAQIGVKKNYLSN